MPTLGSPGDTHSKITGGVFVSAVIQGRDITVQLPPAVTPALSGLPAPSDTFAGRDADVRKLLAALDPNCADSTPLLVCAVSGLAGVGKTELALHAAHHALINENWFPGGALFVDLFGYDDNRRLSPEAALDGLLRALGMPAEHIPPDLQGRSRLYSSVLAAYAAEGKRLLVVIDNAATADQARPLLPADSSNRALVTSRHTLADLGARLYDLNVLDPPAAVDVLRQVLQRARGDSDSRVADEPDAAAASARLCGYLPLALRIVAALLADEPLRPLSSLSEELGDAHTRLDTLQREDRGVRAAFDLSYRRLGEKQSQAFRLLAVAPGADVSTETAAVLLGQPASVARRFLADLARAHLVDARPDERWGLHDLIRLFADEQGYCHAADDQRESALDRVLSHFMTTTALASCHLRPPAAWPTHNRFADRVEALAWLDAEHENLVAAVDIAYRERHYGAAWQLPCSLSPYMAWRQHLQNWLIVARIAIQASEKLGDSVSKAQSLSDLSAALRTRFTRTGDRADLNEAIATSRHAVMIAPADSADRAEYLSNLSAALKAGFDQTGDRFYLDEAIDVGQRCVAAIPGDHPSHAEYLSKLGDAVRTRFERTGELADLDEAIKFSQRAVDATPASHPSLAASLSSLGAALRTRFERTGMLADLDEAVEAAQQAVAVTPGDHPDRATYLHHVGIAWRTRFGRTEVMADLQEAVNAGRDAVEATPTGHPDRATRLAGLGVTLLARFQQTGLPEELDEAIKAGRNAVAATPLDHPDRPRRLSALGAALLAKAEHTKHPAILTETIKIFRVTVEATPPDHPDLATYLNSLGAVLQLLASSSGNGSSIEEAIDCFTRASAQELAPAATRIDAYRALAALLERMDRPRDALIAVEAAVGLLPQLAPRSLVHSDREYGLGRLAALAGQAAAIAVTAGRPERAVELLEETRGVLAAATLDARNSDLTNLRRIAPGLARAFEELRDRIDALDWLQSAPGHETDSPASRPSHAETLRARRDLITARREAVTAWDALIARIRAHDGLHEFLMLSDIHRLAGQADDGPVIIPYTSESRCDALILTGHPDAPVSVVPLTNLTEKLARQQVLRLMAARQAAQDLDSNLASRAAAEAQILDVLKWLWDSVTGPALAALGLTSSPGTGQAWPRVWWCPVGILSLLPLHAAGHHEIAKNDPTVVHPPTALDRVVSSYTTTIRGLAYSRARPRDLALTSTLIVAVPDPPGLHPMPGVDIEMKCVIHLISGALVLSRPVRDTVLAALPCHALVHFAGNSNEDPANPAASFLTLYDYQAAPLTVADISSIQVPGGLAYLSCPGSTTTHPMLANESVHLTGAFHLAGYQHIISLNWPVSDHIATEIASIFYEHITHEGTISPDISLAPHALHRAVHFMRDRYLLIPSLWAAYTHTGM